jgi:hypothetical protein
MSATPAERLLFMMAVAVLLITTGLLIATADAHDALPTAAKPQGWKYPFSCCSGYDCREVSAKQVSEKPEGYVIDATGEIVAYGDARLKDSPDGEYHWCSVAGADDSRTICLFVPPRSY